jgi:hypothetical protein
LSGGLLLALILLLRGKIIIPILIALSLALSFVINNFPIRNVGLELATFAGVIIGRVYGPWWGLAAGGLLVTIHLFASGYFGLYVLWVIPTYAIASTFSGFSQGSIVNIGIIATLFINITEAVFTLIFTPGNIIRHITYALTNVIFNVIIFTLLGDAIILIL